MDLDEPFTDLDINSAILTRNVAALLQNNHTEFVVSNFPNYSIYIITQYNKIGNLYSVKVEQVENGVLNVDPVYNIRHLFGEDSLETEAGVRFIVGQLSIRKPVVICLTLTNYELETLKLVVETLKMQFLGEGNNSIDHE